MCQICLTISHSNENLYVWFMQIMDTLHYLRSAHGTQEEHKSIAQDCKSIFKKVFRLFPNSRLVKIIHDSEVLPSNIFPFIEENSALIISSRGSNSSFNLSIEFFIFISSCLPIKVDNKVPFHQKD